MRHFSAGLDGKEYDLGTRAVLASNGLTHKAILSVLQVPDQHPLVYVFKEIYSLIQFARNCANVDATEAPSSASNIFF